MPHLTKLTKKQNKTYTFVVNNAIFLKQGTKILQIFNYKITNFSI